ncbi:MAG: hypothetical protein ABIP64_14940 [Burkholderiales bacterium]
MLLGSLAISFAHANDAASLRGRYSELQARLAHNQFGRPLYLESTQTSGELKGDVYSVDEHPFSMAQQALQSVDHWCDILILHLNVKGCTTSGTRGANKLSLAVGKKFDQHVEDVYKLELSSRVAAASADYLQVQLNGDQGPLGTWDYRIQLEAVPIDARRSFIHMSYSYRYGLVARMAIYAYLSTAGRKKVGFSFVNRKAGGRPVYIGGMLGLVERNTMRYFLAIDAYLAAYSLPPAEQTERRIHAWHAATERYAVQLHEMDQADYIEMKRNEIRRQKSGLQ